MTDDPRRARTQEESENDEDYRIAVSRLIDNLPTIPLDEVVRELGLDPTLE